MTKYNSMVQHVVKSTGRPYKNLVVDIKEYPGHLAIVVYNDNIKSFSVDKKINIAEYLYKLRDAMRSTGAPVEIEGVMGTPPNSVVAR